MLFVAGSPCLEVHCNICPTPAECTECLAGFYLVSTTAEPICVRGKWVATKSQQTVNKTHGSVVVNHLVYTRIFSGFNKNLLRVVM